MKFLRALLLTTWLYSLLLWFYIVVKITIDQVDMNLRFISAIPYLTFYRLGMISFALSSISLFTYLYIFGVHLEAKK
jgi:hypothetical protein